MPNISKPASYNGGWVRGLEQLLSVTITQPFGQWLSQVLKSEWVSLKSFSNVVETKYLMLAWTNYCWTVFPSTHKKLWWVSGTFFNKEYFLFLETHTHWQVLVSGPFFWVAPLCAKHVSKTLSLSLSLSLPLSLPLSLTLSSSLSSQFLCLCLLLGCTPARQTRVEDSPRIINSLFGVNQYSSPEAWQAGSSSKEIRKRCPRGSTTKKRGKCLKIYAIFRYKVYKVCQAKKH